MMRHWDDECEDEISSVTKYFLSGEEKPVCYSVLPIHWREDQRPAPVNREIILHGISSSGCQKVYKPVIAWKFDLASFDQYKVEVLSKEKKWIALEKPLPTYEEMIKTIRVTLFCLHYLKRNPDASASSLLSNLFTRDTQLSVLQNNLTDHMAVIKSAVEHDETLASSKFLLAFLESPRRAFTEDIGGAVLATKKSKHNVNDDWGEPTEEKTNTEIDDSVCAICDNGGDVLCCDGGCRRCFHATVADAGADAKCESLGLSTAEVAAPKFICLNCRYKQHQCFACGKLGSSDSSSAQEVFRCASCGHFYHPKCAADLLDPGNEELQKTIAAGDSFICPAHKCSKCKQGENSSECGLQFAVCRRCPKAYHRNCLPSAFKYTSKLGFVQRAWENLLPKNRILIYCQKHEIGKNQTTPARNHIVFPNVAVKANVQSPLHHSSQQRVLKRRRTIHEEIPIRISLNQIRSDEKIAKRFSVQRLDTSKRPSTGRTSKMIREDNTKSVIGHSHKKQKVPLSSISPEPPIAAESKKRIRTLVEDVARTVPLSSISPEPPIDAETKNKITTLVEDVARKVPLSSISPEPPIDAEIKNKIRTLVEDVARKVSSSDIKREYRCRAKQAVYKVVNTANSQKAEGSDRAVRTTLKKLKEGPSFEESKDVVEPKILNKITKWKVVDKLRSYVLEGNMIVNASYAANDFTRLMRQRLEEVGINCSFEDYGVYQSKNGSTAEKCDWLRAHQLSTGTKLIIVLNIPFGINSALADKCIDKALGFRPKLLVLFVPEDIKRLDKPEYNLLWEDNKRLLSKFSHSFVSISDDGMKLWNSKPPLLQFWSRCDWFAKHKKIVERMPMDQNDSNVESEEENQEQEYHKEKVFSDSTNDHGESHKLSSMSQEEENQEQEHHEGSTDSPSIHAVPGEHQLKVDNENVKSSKSRSDTKSGHGLFDFAPGPYNPFSHDKHSCCGWIDDGDMYLRQTSRY